MQKTGKNETIQLFIKNNWINFPNLFLLLICVGSRIATTIFYTEDPDSLRFALAAIDFDVLKEQPHFPAYPVYIALIKTIHFLIPNYSVSFSIAGGIATFGIIYILMKWSQTKINEIKGQLIAFLILANPMIWLMGNRYMPDLLGACVLLIAGYLIAHSEKIKIKYGMFFLGLLIGTRLSYLPFVLPLLVLNFRELLNIKAKAVGYLVLGLIVWLIPLILDTGLKELIEMALRQSSGHFNEFGGAVTTEPNFLLRFSKLIEAILADGLGGYWLGRNVITLIVTVCLFYFLFKSLMTLKYLKDKNWLWMCMLIYLLWIMLGQNVIYKSRHVLPLIPILLLMLSRGLYQVYGKSILAKIICSLFLTSYLFVGVYLAWQHKSPTAIYQSFSYLKENNKKGQYIVCAPLVKDFFVRQQLSSNYIIIRNKLDYEALKKLNEETIVYTVGNHSEYLSNSPLERKTFSHNKYVNRLWPSITISKYKL